MLHPSEPALLDLLVLNVERLPDFTLDFGMQAQRVAHLPCVASYQCAQGCTLWCTIPMPHDDDGHGCAACGSHHLPADDEHQADAWQAGDYPEEYDSEGGRRTPRRRTRRRRRRARRRRRRKMPRRKKVKNRAKSAVPAPNQQTPDLLRPYSATVDDLGFVAEEAKNRIRQGKMVTFQEYSNPGSSSGGVQLPNPRDPK